MMQCTKCERRISHLDVDGIGALLCPKCWGRNAELELIEVRLHRHLRNVEHKNKRYSDNIKAATKRAVQAETKLYFLREKIAEMEKRYEEETQNAQAD